MAINIRGLEGKLPAGLGGTVPGNQADVANNAVTTGTGKIDELKSWLTYLTAEILALAGYALMLAILISGLIYLFSSGDESKTASAKKNIVWAVTGFVIVMSAYGIFSWVVTAATPAAEKLTSLAGATAVIGTVVDIILAIAGFGLMLMLLINGFRYLLGSGNEEATTSAKKGMLDAIIGIFIVVIAYAFAAYIQGKT